MTATIEQRVLDIIKEMLPTSKEIKGTDKLVDDLGADSLDCIQVVMELEEEFDIRIDDDELEGLVTVSDVVAIVTRLANDSEVK